MAARVRALEDPQQVLGEAGDFLAGDPVRHHLILTLLHGRVQRLEPGRYWIVDVNGRPAGVIFHSPLTFVATLTPMAPEAVTAAVEAIVGSGATLPGVHGDAATAARFAGHWAERAKTGARPVLGQRIYEVAAVHPVRAVPGHLRRADGKDRDLAIGWIESFQAEIGEAVGVPAQMVDRHLTDGRLWVWDDAVPVALAACSATVAGMVRIGPVFTPKARRGLGYASALVAGVSGTVRSGGDRCILYTDLANPISNSIYRACGYRAVAEVLRYAFDQQGA